MQILKNVKKGKVSSIIAAAICIAGIGAVTLVTVSRYKSFKKLLNFNTESIVSEEKESNISKNDEPTVKAKEEVNDDTSAKDVAGKTESEPYQTNETQTAKQFVMPIDGTVTKPYSDTTLQPSETFGDMRLHEGIDIKCDEGTPVRTAASGKVAQTLEDASLGKVVVVESGEGITVKYCGLKEISVKDGQTLNAGDVIGTSGNPPFESADQPHIHIEATISEEVVSPLEALGLE